MNKNFFEVKNADFKVGGKIKVANVSFAIENDTFLTLVLPPTLKSTFCTSKKLFIRFSQNIFRCNYNKKRCN